MPSKNTTSAHLRELFPEMDLVFGLGGIFVGVLWVVFFGFLFVGVFFDAN